MIDRDLFKEILQVIVRNPMRTFLSGLGMSWGIFMLIIMFGASKGLENGVKGDMSNRAENSAFIWSRRTTMPYKGFKKNRRFDITMDNVAYLEQNVPEIDLISPRCQLGGYRGSNNVVRGVNTGAFNIYGDFPQYIKIQPQHISEGRYINFGDINEARKVCVIGDRVKQVLFEKGEQALGDYIKINGVNFKVVGVYQSMRQGEDAEEEEQSIFVPFSTFQKAFNYNVVGWLSVLSDPEVPVQITEDRVKSVLKSLHSIHPADDRAFGSWNMQEEMEEMDTVFGGIEMVVGFIGILVLIAGAIGICNIMLITVKERTKEFGIRRSIGATPITVVTQVLIETLFLTLVAGLAGMMVGVFALEGINMMLASMGSTGSFREPSIGLNIVLVAMAIMVGAGVLFGILPATRAVSIKPVDALRTEG